jgi:hypothetical protein
VKQLVSQWTDFVIVLLSDKNISHLMYDLFIDTGRNTVKLKYSQHFCARPHYRKQSELIAWGENDEIFACARSHPHIFLCFICTSIRQETIMSPLKWNMLRLIHHHN